MADKAIGELTAAASVNPADLFVLEQNNTAKKLSGQTLENWLLSFADGHGGIQSIVRQSSAGLTDHYRITLADTSVFDFAVTNGRGIAAIDKTGSSGLTDTYEIRYTDGSTSSFAVTNGEKGDKGDQTNVWIRYASQQPTAQSHDFGTLPDEWMGICVGTDESAPTDYTRYQWYRIKGDTGDDARVEGFSLAYQASQSGTAVPEGTWLDVPPDRIHGGYIWTRTRTTYFDGSQVDSYTVAYQGMDGSGAVSTVNGVEPHMGNVVLTAADIGAVAKTALLDLVYPVGSIYLSVAETSPASLFGGFWERLRDVFLLAAGEHYSVSDEVQDGGTAEVTLTVEQIPAHHHSVNFVSQGDNSGTTARRLNSAGDGHITSGDAGGGGAHNNMPPYKTVYMWQRKE